MPLSPSSSDVDDNLTVNGHNEVDAISCGYSHLLAISTQHRCKMVLGDFLRLGRQRQEEGIEVWCRCKIGHHQRRCHHCRGQVQKQASEGGGGVYGENMIAQQSGSDISSNPNEWSHS